MSEFLNRYWQTLGGSGAARAPEGGVPASAPRSQTLSDLQKGASVGSAILAIASGASEARSLQRQAGDQIVASEAELAEATRNANAQRRAALQASARLRVAFAAGGVDLGSGTVQQLDRELRTAADEEIGDTLARGSERRRARRIYAKRLTRRAAETFGGALIGGAATAADALGG